jgi:hypothetical protein
MSNRIYYANQQVAFKSNVDDDWTVAHGVQSVGIATTFTLEQAFELGQISIYENIEAVPEIQTTITKVLDGYSGLYGLATSGAETNSFVDRSSQTSFIALGIWPDTNSSATGSPSQQVEMSGMAITSVGYELPIDDNFTETVTLVGDNKAWLYGDLCATPGWTLAQAQGGFSNNDSPRSGVQRREGFNLTDSILPVEATGFGAKMQSISVSVDLGRENLFELGTKKPYARVVNFPVEVTCNIEVLSLSGDMVSAFAAGCSDSSNACDGVASNVSDQQITIAVCDGTTINLGNKNRLASVNHGGGDAGGGNSTTTYSYVTFNDFTVIQTEIV